MSDIAARNDANPFSVPLRVHDSAIGLLTRDQFTELVERSCSQQDIGHHLALMRVDLDRFSLQALGHDVGDDILRNAARQITAAVRPGDAAARLGRGEFLVLCLTVSDAHCPSAIADRFLQFFDRPDALAGAEQRATVPLELDLALRKALMREEFVLHFQPIYNATDSTHRGFEALIRWNRPGFGMVPPDEFIPAAEETGRILQIGDWVMDEALRQLSAWRRSPGFPPGLTVSVNLSPLQLADRNLVSIVQRLLTKHQLCPSDLTLEMTETAFVADQSQMQATVTGLVATGVGLSIDDFGTGHSSLSYLRYLPANELKIDRSFVAGLTTNTRDAALVSALIALAHELDMICVAEGVETAEQLEHLQRLGCDRVQGYFLGRPAPASALTEAWQE